MMNKMLLAAAAAMVIGGSAFGEMKYGTVDLMLLIRNHPNYESNKELLTSTDKDYQKKLETIKSEGEKFQEEGRKLAEQMQNPMLSQKAKQDVEKQLMDLQKKLMGIEQRYRSEALRCRQDLQELEARLLKTTTEDLRKKVKAYAEKNGYDFIFDKSAAPFSKDSFDVTTPVLKSMGVDPKAIKTKDESK